MLKKMIDFFQILNEKRQIYVRKISNWLLIQIYRFSISARLQSARQALELQRKSTALIDAEIRLCRDSLPQIGEDDDTDMVVEYVARQLTNRPYLSELDKALEKHSELAVALLADAKSSSSVRNTARLYFLADSFIQSILSKHQEEEESFQLACTFDSNAEKLKVTDLNKSLRLTKKRYREVRTSLAERSALKVDVKLSDISTVVGLISICVAISGYLHTHYFYSLFGIDVSLFFGITDYLAASVEQIRYGAIAAFFAFISLLYGLRAGSTRSVAHFIATKKQRKQGQIITLFCIIVMSGLSILTIYLDRPSFPLIQLMVVIFSQRISWSISHKFFSRPLPAFISMMGLLIFTGCIAVAGYQKYFEILHTQSNSNNIQVILKDEVFKGQNETYLLGSNSSFLFLLDIKNRTVHVVPRLQLKEIRVLAK